MNKKILYKTCLYACLSICCYSTSFATRTFFFQSFNTLPNEVRPIAKTVQGEKHYANGEYKGSLVNDQPEGQGTMICENGNKYEGSFINGQPNGQGKMIYANGDIYEGSFINGKPDGQGTMIYVNGNTYEGEWKDGKKHGHGKMTHTNGDTYDGELKDDIVNGHGIWIHTGVTKYDGEWKDSEKMQSTGSYTGRNRYIGQFKNSALDGKGKLTYRYGGKPKDGFWRKGKYLGADSEEDVSWSGSLNDGEWQSDEYGSKKQGAMTYTGQWKDNKPSGYGEVRNEKDEVVYEGQWANGKFHDQGKLMSEDGYYDGQWCFGNRHGVGKVLDKEGNFKFEATWQLGKRIKVL